MLPDAFQRRIQFSITAHFDHNQEFFCLYFGNYQHKRNVGRQFEAFIKKGTKIQVL